MALIDELKKIDHLHPFSSYNIPFGVAAIDADYSVHSRFGDFGINLKALSELGYFSGSSFGDLSDRIFSQSSLNDFIALGKCSWSECRKILQKLLRDVKSIAVNDLERIFIPIGALKMKLPVEIGDYTDFYASKEHATNVGVMFRGKENALMPNWVHMPIGYHGRASSIVVSGTEIRRPKGQLKLPESSPIFDFSRKLDFELEMGFIVGVGNDQGTSVTMDSAGNHIFGVVLLNDWSARDIQAWEYVPLGPFLGKSFATTISPWIVTIEALEPFQTDGPIQEPAPLPYLLEKNPSAYDIDLEVILKSGESSDVICASNLKYMYWSFKQQLVHHTSNGCNMRTGDLCGTGTISGKDTKSYGSLLELSWNGQNPLKLSNGEERTFLEDEDEIILTASAKKDNICVGFGECIGKISR